MSVADNAVVEHVNTLTDVVPRPTLLFTLTVFLLAPLTSVGFITTEIMIFAIAVVGFDILIGYTGYVSFGQALFFGGGAYSTAFAVEYFGLSFLPAVLGTVVLTVLIAALIGCAQLPTARRLLRAAHPRVRADVLDDGVHLAEHHRWERGVLLRSPAA